MQLLSSRMINAFAPLCILQFSKNLSSKIFIAPLFIVSQGAKSIYQVSDLVIYWAAKLVCSPLFNLSLYLSVSSLSALFLCPSLSQPHSFVPICLSLYLFSSFSSPFLSPLPFFLIISMFLGYADKYLQIIGLLLMRSADNMELLVHDRDIMTNSMQCRKPECLTSCQPAVCHFIIHLIVSHFKFSVGLIGFCRWIVPPFL